MAIEAITYVAVLVGMLIVVDVVARYFFPRLFHGTPWWGMDSILFLVTAVVGALYWFAFK